MNRLNDEQMDRIIKEEMKKDTFISEKANSIFSNFNPQLEEKAVKNEDIERDNKNVINAVFYKRLNKVLSVAAVLLTVVLVGGTTLYFNRDKLQNNQNNQNETVTYTTNNLIKNEPMHFSNEQVIKEIEDDFVKVYLVGNRDIGVEFKSSYWDEVLGNVIVSSETYKIDGINDEIKDIFIGKAENSAVPYIFTIMKDGTAMYVDLHRYYNNYSEYYYVAMPIVGLYDVVGFEEKTRKFSYSNTDYTFVNAIRSDGKRKEIEIGKENNWDNTSSETFEKLNEKYVKAHEGKEIPDDGKGDFEVDGIHYYTINKDNEHVYCLKGDSMHRDLYRIERSTGKETCIATGISGMARDNSDGRISFYVIKNDYIIYELDDNIIYKDSSNNTVINEVTRVEEKTENQQENDKPNIQELSEFEKKVYESGNYYYSKNGHYCIKNPREANIAYYIENYELYRVIIPNNDSSTCVATGVDDLVVDEAKNLIVTVQPNCSVSDLHEGNVIFKEYNITNSRVIKTYSNENIEITLKDDGSLTARILEGGLQRLGYNSEKTTICEGVYYNMFGSTHGVENKQTHLYYASAKKGILTKAGKNARLCFVYEKSDGYVIAIDILSAIGCGSFTGAATSQCYIDGKIAKFEIAKFADDTDENGNAIPEYDTVFVLVKDKSGNEVLRHPYMPCEDI